MQKNQWKKKQEHRDGARRGISFASFARWNDEIDYKDTGLIKRHTSPRGKFLPPKITGTCAKHQRTLSKAIKRARYIGLLPFVKV